MSSQLLLICAAALSAVRTHHTWISKPKSGARAALCFDKKTNVWNKEVNISGSAASILILIVYHECDGATGG